MSNLTTETKMLIGRQVTAMSDGDIAIIECDKLSKLAPHVLADAANAFARKRGLRITVCQTPDGLQMAAKQRGADLILRLDTMAPGERRRINCLESQHVNVRVRASAAAKKIGCRFMVRKIDANTVEVTRLKEIPPVDEKLRAAFEARVMALPAGTELRLTMKSLTRDQARDIVANLAAEHRRVLIVDDTDTGVLVTRWPDQVRTTPGRPKGSGRWNFYTLKAPGDSMSVGVTPADMPKLRQAAYIFSRREGIKLSVSVDDAPGMARVMVKSPPQQQVTQPTL